MSTRILILDDDVALSALLQEHLTSHTYACDVVNSEQDALVKLRKEPYDVLITDIVMELADLGPHEVDGDSQDVAVVLEVLDVAAPHRSSAEELAIAVALGRSEQVELEDQDGHTSHARRGPSVTQACRGASPLPTRTPTARSTAASVTAPGRMGRRPWPAAVIHRHSSLRSAREVCRTSAMTWR